MGATRRELGTSDREANLILRRLLLSGASLGVVTVVAKGLGFLEKIFQARGLGTSSELDAYLVAISVPGSIHVFARELIEPAVLPLYVALLKSDGIDRARRFAATMGGTVLLLGLLCVVIFWVGGERMVEALAPGLERDSRAQCMRLLHATAPGGAILALAALTGIVLNAHKHFVLPASSDLAMRSILVLGFAVIVPRFGLGAMGVVFLAACLARLLVHLPILARTGGFARPTSPTDASFRQGLRLAAPLAFGMVFSTLGGLVDNNYASRLGEGYVSALSFARKLTDLPLLILSYSLSTAAFPYFADMNLSADRMNGRHLLRPLLSWSAIVFGAITSVMLLGAEDIVRIVFERGAFGEDSVAKTTPILFVYAIGLVPLAIESILVLYYFSRKDIVRPVVVGMIGVVIHVVLLAATWEQLGAISMPVSYTVAKTFKVLVLLGWLDRSWRERLRSALPLGVAVLLAVASYGTGTLLLRAFQPDAIWSRLVFTAMAGGAIYVVGLVVYISHIRRQSRRRAQSGPGTNSTERS